MAPVVTKTVTEEGSNLTDQPPRDILRHGKMPPPVRVPGQSTHVARSGLTRPCRKCTHRNFCLPEGLETEQVDRLEGAFSGRRILRQNVHLFHTGEVQSSIYAVRSGVIKLFRIGNNDDEQVVDFRLPGEMLGLGALGMEAYATSAVAIEASSVCELPVARLEEICGEIPRLQRQLFRLFARQIDNTRKTLTITRKRRVDARLASFLLNIAQRYKAQGYSGSEFHLSMSRKEIGNYLGIRVETLSRLFTRFHKEKLLKVDKRHIIIQLPDDLNSVAGAGPGQTQQEKCA